MKMIRRLEVERIRNAVLRLPDGYRVVVSLYLFEGYDHEEIGEVLGISETTSRTQYMRGKRKLTEILGKELDERINATIITKEEY